MKWGSFRVVIRVLFLNFDKWVDWWSSTTGMSQIWIEDRQESRISLESWLVLATNRNWLSKYGEMWVFPSKYGNFCSFFPSLRPLYKLHCVLFCYHGVKIRQKINKWLWWFAVCSITVWCFCDLSWYSFVRISVVCVSGLGFTLWVSVNGFQFFLYTR